MNGREQSIKNIMTQPVRSVTAETPACDVATILLEESVGSVVIADADGIVTKTDLLAGIENDQLEEPVAGVMTTPVVTVSPEADVQTAIDRMDEYEIKRLVVETDTEVVGVVSTTDIRQTLATELDSVIDMFAGSAVVEGEDTYECMSCGERVTATRKPGTCSDCDAPMRNISVPRN